MAITIDIVQISNYSSNIVAELTPVELNQIE